MRKYLLPQEGTFYKANLHAHTIMSDGRQTPEEVRELFKSLGYSIVAYTDHDIFVDRSYLAEEGFLPLNGLEMEVNGINYGRGWTDQQSCHMNFIALDPNNLTVPCYHRTKYLYANAPKYRHLMTYDETLPDFDRFYSAERINAMFLEGRNKGFFTTYNHPIGSLERYPFYSQLNYMHAMEIYNGPFENNSHVYDDMLLLGRDIYCIGGDDSHSVDTSGHSWTMIKAAALDYRTVTKALMDGHFYASQGPEIFDLYVEDGMMHVTTSDAQEIHFVTAARAEEGKSVAAKDGQFLNEASFKILPESVYVRVVVVGPNGKTASTNAFATYDLLH